MLIWISAFSDIMNDLRSTKIKQQKMFASKRVTYPIITSSGSSFKNINLTFNVEFFI